MREVNRRAVIAIVRTFVMLVAVIFLPAWTLDYWQAWACLAAFFVPSIAITVWVARHDPALLERRLKAGARAETEKGQKIVQAVAAVVFMADFAIPALDHRFKWSSVPTSAAIIGDLLMVFGFVLVFEVFKANRFTSGIIEVMADQQVISSGPYAVVRHPMYSGALMMLFGIPMAMASWWGLLVNFPMTGALAWRLLDEERFLVEKLPGYKEYREKVK